MAWNYYPPIPDDMRDTPPRLHAHADMDIITLLYQRAEDRGLEIAPGKEASSAFSKSNHDSSSFIGCINI